MGGRAQNLMKLINSLNRKTDWRLKGISKLDLLEIFHQICWGIQESPFEVGEVCEN